MSHPRVAPPRIFPSASRAARPAADSPGADAHRQSGFVLGDDIDLVVSGLNLEGAVAEASSASKYRKQPMAAGLGLWSRSWLSRLQALHAAESGNYGAAITLVRAAADFQAAELLVHETDAAEWMEWLEEPAIAVEPAHHATLYRLHPFRAAEILARHETLAAVYRASSDLSMPHFGATLLLAASDSTPDRVLVAFGDRDFHQGLAEIAFGWLLALGMVKAERLLADPAPYHVPEPGPLEAWLPRARGRIDARERCRILALDEPEYRYVVENWRRAPGGATRRILL